MSPHTVMDRMDGWKGLFVIEGHWLEVCDGTGATVYISRINLCHFFGYSFSCDGICVILFYWFSKQLHHVGSYLTLLHFCYHQRYMLRTPDHYHKKPVKTEKREGRGAVVFSRWVREKQSRQESSGHPDRGHDIHVGVLGSSQCSRSLFEKRNSMSWWSSSTLTS